jgi:hypothetical protein
VIRTHIQINKTRTPVKRIKPMFEVAMSPEAREAIKRAHVERSRAAKSAFEWLFPSKTSR